MKVTGYFRGIAQSATGLSRPTKQSRRLVNLPENGDYGTYTAITPPVADAEG